MAFLKQRYHHVQTKGLHHTQIFKSGLSWDGLCTGRLTNPLSCSLQWQLIPPPEPITTGVNPRPACFRLKRRSRCWKMQFMGSKDPNIKHSHTRRNPQKGFPGSPSDGVINLATHVNQSYDRELWSRCWGDFTVLVVRSEQLPPTHSDRLYI